MEKRQRRSIRLPGFDYASPGAYFVTLVAWRREPIFGEIVAGEMQLNSFGDILREEWENTPSIRAEIELGIYQIMPNHIHAILVIRDIVGAHGSAPNLNSRAPSPEDDVVQILPDPFRAYGRTPLQKMNFQRQPRSLGSCIAGIKSITTKRINLARHTPGEPVWQRNYYEHIVHDPEDWQRIYAYIQVNPDNWQLDEENPLKVQ